MSEPLTVDEVAERLRLGREAVLYAIEQGRLRANREYTPGDRTPYEIREAEVRRFLAHSARPKKRTRSSMTELPKLYTLPEVAEKTRLPLRWLQDNVRSGGIPHLRPGRHPMMTSEDVDAAIAYARKNRPADIEVQAELDRRSQVRSVKRAA